MPIARPARPTRNTVMQAVGVLLAGCALAATASAQAQPAPAAAAEARAYSIPPGPLGETLNRFASAAGVALSFSAERTQGKQSPGLSGQFGVADGFARVLAGSGLQARQTGPGRYALEPQAMPQPQPSATAAASAAAATALAPVTVTARAERDSRTEGSGAYATRELSLGKGQSLKDITHAVSVVTRQQIQDQNLTSLTEVLDKTTGITLAQSGASSSSFANDSNFYSRGFLLGNVQMDGGASTATAFGGWAGSVSRLDMAQFDHVEFLRGVDGLFSSTGEPGGTVNLVRKRPQAERAASVALQAGRWDRYRVEADATGPLAWEGRLRGRAGLALEDRRNFYEIAKDSRQAVYGSLETDLTPDTMLTVGGSYQRDRGVPFGAGLPRYSNGEDLGLPRSTALTTDWNRSNEWARQLYARVEHRLDADWRLNVNLDRLQIDRDATSLFNSGAVDPVSHSGAFWFGSPAQTGSTRTTFNTHLQGSFEALGRRHQLLAGLDLERGNAHSYQGSLDLAGTPLDVFAIVRPPAEASLPQNNWWDYQQRREALYGSLQWALSDALQLIGGGRYARYRFESDARFTNVDPRSIRFKESGMFTPYAGLRYALNPRWTTYASYAETYKPQYQQLAGPLPGTALGPVESRNLEAGVKGELVPGRLNLALAVYRIERNGEAMVDPSYPQSWGAYNCCYLNRGEVVSQGFDAELSGEVLRGLQLVAGYTFNSNHSRDDASNARYNSVTPKHLFKLWGVYQLPGAGQAWKLGAGVTAQSANYVSGTASTYNPDSGQWDGASLPFRFVQGGYALWSMRVAYQIDPRWQLALNVSNLFDKRYYQTVGTSRNGNFYGEPRNAVLSLRAQF